MDESDIYQYAMDRLASGADAERVIQELTGAHIDSSRVRDIVGIASLTIIRRDHYEVLGVPRAASSQEIKIAYRQKALQYHPDRNINPGAAERFKQLNVIYSTLSDPIKRVEYDRSLADAPEAFGERRSGGAFSGGYRRRSESGSPHTSTDQKHQATRHDAEVEESWCEILANLAFKVVGAAIGFAIGGAIGFGIVWLVLRLWDPWD